MTVKEAHKSREAMNELQPFADADQTVTVKEPDKSGEAMNELQPPADADQTVTAKEPVSDSGEAMNEQRA